jgi:hypothetical protein
MLGKPFCVGDAVERFSRSLMYEGGGLLRYPEEVMEKLSVGG